MVFDENPRKNWGFLEGTWKGSWNSFQSLNWRWMGINFIMCLQNGKLLMYWEVENCFESFTCSSWWDYVAITCEMRKLWYEWMICGWLVKETMKKEMEKLWMWHYCKGLEHEEMLWIMGIIALYISSFIIVHCGSKLKRFTFMREIGIVIRTMEVCKG